MSVQRTLISILSQKRLKPTNNCLEALNSFVSVSMVKMCHNPKPMTNYKSQRWIRSVYTTLIPIFSQKRLKPIKILLETINNFVSVYMVKMYHNPKPLTNYKSQRWIRSVQTTLIPIFSQKRLKPTNICLDAVNSFVSVSMVKMFHNPMNLTNYRVRDGLGVFKQQLYPFSPKKG